MNDVDLDGLASDLGFVLKAEQKEAVESLLRGKDVFGVLPTGFGKSLIFQLFVLVKTNRVFSPHTRACEARALHTRGSRFPPSENDCFAV